jgi:hypothetical protein
MNFFRIVLTIILRHSIQTGSGWPGAGKKAINLANMRKQIDEAFGLKKLEAVFLSVNSPGKQIR